MSFSLTALAFTIILEVMRQIGLPGLFALMAVESFGVPPLPSEIILPFAGVLIVTGAPDFNWPSVMFAALSGGLVGALAAYQVGRWAGLPVLRRLGSRVGLEERDLERAEDFFARRGPITVFLARLVPIIRAFISYPAGAARMDRVRFSVYTVAGAAPFTAALVWAGTVLGSPSNFRVLQQDFGYLDYVAGAAIVVGLLWVLYRARRRQRHPTAAPTSGTTVTTTTTSSTPPRARVPPEEAGGQGSGAAPTSAR